MQRFRNDEDGASLLEFTIIATLLFTLLFGIIEFGNNLIFYLFRAAP